MPPSRLLAFIALLPFAMAQAASYRWVDENGTTIYSQTPPPKGVEASEIKAPPPPPQAAEEETEEGAGKPKERNDADSEKDAKKKKLAEEAEKKKAEETRQRNCDSARKNLGVIENSKFKTVRAPDGTTQKLDDETRAAMRKEAEGDIQEHCGKKK